MRLALLTTMAAAAFALGGCAVHPMAPMRMADATGPAGTCPMAAAEGQGHVHGMPGMQGGHGMMMMQGGQHAAMHAAMHGAPANAGAPAAGTPALTCPAAQPNVQRQ